MGTPGRIVDIITDIGVAGAAIALVLYAHSEGYYVAYRWARLRPGDILDNQVRCLYRDSRRLLIVAFVVFTNRPVGVSNRLDSV